MKKFLSKIKICSILFLFSLAACSGGQSNKNDEILDFTLITMCKNVIISNSSFSWWGSWLANSKKTVAPKNWFGMPLSHDTKDLYRQGWIVI